MLRDTSRRLSLEYLYCGAMLEVRFPTPLQPSRRTIHNATESYNL